MPGIERHYTLTELEKQTHISRRTLKRWFENEAGVIRFGEGQKLKKGRQRVYVSLRVPESVAERVLRSRRS